MKSVLCVALNPTIDVTCVARRVEPTRKVRTRDQSQRPGGGGVNVARVMAELGGDPRLLYLCGGATGALLDDLIAASPLRRSRIAIAGAVRMAFMVHEETTGSEFRFVPEGPEISVGELETALAAVAADRSEYVVASGSLPRGAPADTYKRMARMAAERGGRFVLDAAGEALRLGLSDAPVFLVKPSLGELEELVGRKLGVAGAEEGAKELVARAAALHVVVTLGADGALVASADGVRTLRAEPVAVHTAVGAGDSFVAAMVWALAGGDNLAAAFEWGLAAATATVASRGPDLCSSREIVECHAQLMRTTLDHGRPVTSAL